MRRDERGQVLMLTVGFVAFIGVVAVALGSFITSNFLASGSLKQVRANQFAAEGAVDAAITVFRNSLTPLDALDVLNLNNLELGLNCVLIGMPTTTLNGRTYTPACSTNSATRHFGVTPFRVDDTFTVCQQGGGSCAFPVLVARVVFTGTFTQTAAVSISAWSIPR
jgi:hypothetical protein